MKRLIAVIALACASAFGQAAGTGIQIPIGGAPDMPSGSALPATCSPNGSPKVFFKTTAPIGLQQCLSANTWSTIGGSSTTFQAAGVGLTSSTTVNFQASSPLAVTNPSAGNVQYACATCATTTNGGALAGTANQTAISAAGVISLASPLTTPGAATITGTLAETGAITLNGTTSGSTTINPGTTAAALTIGVPILAANGTNSNTSYAFTNAASAGLYYTGSNVVLQNGSTTSVNVNSNGNVVLGTSDASHTAFIQTGNLGFVSGKGQHFVTQAAANDMAGTCTASAATTCTVTFTTAYTSVPSCTATDQTNITTLKVTPATGSLIITTTGSSSDVFAYHCVGNPN